MKNASVKSSLTDNNTRFIVIGINYKKADAEVRGKFSLADSQQIALLTDAPDKGINSLSIISTCNRTELYGFAASADSLITLLCTHTEGTKAAFLQSCYLYTDVEAARHLFRVGTGLDSQILGDFEIISQLRKAFKASKKAGLLNPYMERLINDVIRASKKIKNETNISSGATSVSFAAVQYILARVPYVSNKNILLFGTGKIGRNTCENLVKHTKNKHITLINRTKEKAQQIAGKFNLIVADYNQLQSEIAQTDVLIVSTGAQNPTISKQLLHLNKPLLILDLSIPKNVANDVTQNPLVHLVHLDDLSRITEDTLSQRQAQVPKALEFIDEILNEFLIWAEKRKFAPTLRALKAQLNTLSQAEIDNQRKKIDNFNHEQAEILSNRIIHKITTHFANHLNQATDQAQEHHDLIQQVFKLDAPDS